MLLVEGQNADTSESDASFDDDSSGIPAVSGASSETEVEDSTDPFNADDSPIEESKTSEDTKKPESRFSPGALFNYAEEFKNKAIAEAKKLKDKITGGDSSTSTGTQTPDTSPLGTPEAIDCTKYETTTFNNTKFESEEFSGSNDDLKAQLCAFMKQEDNKAFEGLSAGQKQNFVKAFNKQYQTNLQGIEHVTEWSNSKLILKDGTKINLDLNSYYSEDNANRAFSFREESDYEYDRQPIREIIIGEDGSTKITFGDKATGENNADGQSNITLPKGSEFDPQNMKITVGDKKLDWNGRGNVDLSDGKLRINFADGASDTDVTNFPIMKMEDGTEISPYQAQVTLKPTKSITKPSKGFRVFEQDGKQYTIDSKGVYREIKNTEIEFGDKGEIKTIKDGYVGNFGTKHLGLKNSNLFANGKYGIGKSAGTKSYIDIDNNILTINSESGNTLYFKQGSNLNKLDVTGKGTTYLRNGDYIIQFKDGKMVYKKLPKPLQNIGGKLEFTTDEIVNPKDSKNPYKIVKDGESFKLVDKEGKPLSEGELGLPPPTQVPPGQTPPGKPGIGPGMTEKSKGTVTLETKNSATPSEFSGIGTFDATQQKLTVSGLDKLPKDLTYDQFLEKFGNTEGLNLEFELQFISGRTSKANVLAGLESGGIPKGSPLYNLIAEKVNVLRDPSTFPVLGFWKAPNDDGEIKGKKLTFNIAGNDISATFNGKPITKISSHKNQVLSFLKKSFRDPQKPRKDDKTLISPQYLNGNPVSQPGGQNLFNYYRSL